MAWETLGRLQPGSPRARGADAGVPARSWNEFVPGSGEESEVAWRLVVVNRTGEVLEPAGEGQASVPGDEGRLELDLDADGESLRSAAPGAPNGCRIRWELSPQGGSVEVEVLHFADPAPPTLLTRERFPAHEGPHLIELEPGFRVRFR